MPEILHIFENGKSETPKMRSILIENTDTTEKYETCFDANTVKDSHAFKWMLAFVDPGDNYTVTFKNVESEAEKQNRRGSDSLNKMESPRGY